MNLLIVLALTLALALFILTVSLTLDWLERRIDRLQRGARPRSPSMITGVTGRKSRG